MGEVWDNMYEYEVMSEEEKCCAAANMKNGDAAARESLIVTNFRFVVDRAEHYARMGVDRNDLIAVGCNALAKYIDKYDPKRGELTTCMAPYIDGAIKDELNRSARTIRLPKRLIMDIRKMHTAEKELAGKLSRPATTGEIAAEMGCSAKKVQELKKVKIVGISLDKKIGDDGRRPLEEILILDNDTGKKDMLRSIRNCFMQLAKEDQDLLSRTIINGQKVSEIAAKAGVSRQCMDQKKARALKRLKEIIRKNYPDLLAA